MDLSCISHARQMIENNNYVRRCNLSDDTLILSKTMEIMDKQVLIQDNNTYVLCSYDEYRLIVYYDEKGISGIDYH